MPEATVRELRHADAIRTMISNPASSMISIALIGPRCGEFLTVVNPCINLARCFRCEVNFNIIDLTMSIKECNFVAPVYHLQSMLPPSKAS